jgi:transcriptional regulator with PAS, ATPase and Fis domain
MPKRTRTTRRLEVWLKDTDQALFVLNAQRRLVFFNSGSERLTGWSASDLLGQKCDYVSEADACTPAALLAALAPPPEVWSGQQQQVPINIPGKISSPQPRVVHYFPLADTDRDVKAILGIIVDVPEASPPTPISASQRLHAEIAALRQSVRQRYGDGSLIGRSQPIQRAFQQVKLAQASSSAVLFVGETGVGKEHLARVLHYQSSLGKKAFVPLNCHTTSSDLNQTLSRLRDDQQADSLQAGAVYFDQIDKASALFQQMLLEWMSQMDGSVSLRIMSSSTRPLLPLVEAELFSEALYFRLTPLVVELPPLRDRMEDLEPLAQYFLEELNRDFAKQVAGFSEEVWRQFRRYHWLGNAGELRQVIVEAQEACDGPMVKPEHLPFRFRAGVTAQTMEPSQRPRVVPLDGFLEQVEREQIERALVESRDNKARAAELLGITRPRLYRRMEHLGIVDPDASK